MKKHKDLYNVACDRYRSYVGANSYSGEYSSLVQIEIKVHDKLFRKMGHPEWDYWMTESLSNYRSMDYED